VKFGDEFGKLNMARVQIALAKVDRFIETIENREGNIELNKLTYTRLNLYI
jgi:hypothetical protein